MLAGKATEKVAGVFKVRLIASKWASCPSRIADRLHLPINANRLLSHTELKTDVCSRTRVALASSSRTPRMERQVRCERPCMTLCGGLHMRGTLQPVRLTAPCPKFDVTAACLCSFCGAEGCGRHWC